MDFTPRERTVRFHDFSCTEICYLDTKSLVQEKVLWLQIADPNFSTGTGYRKRLGVPMDNTFGMHIVDRVNNLGSIVLGTFGA